MSRQLMMEVAGEVFPIWTNEYETTDIVEHEYRTVGMSFTVQPIDYERAHNAIAIANREGLGVTMRSPNKEEVCENPQF